MSYTTEGHTTPDDNRRLVHLAIDQDIMVDILSGKFRLAWDECLPKDAIFLGVYIDGNICDFLLRFKHRSFDIVTEGEVIPRIPYALDPVEKQDPFEPMI